jgi:hypothetical protein
LAGAARRVGHYSLMVFWRDKFQGPCLGLMVTKGCQDLSIQVKTRPTKNQQGLLDINFSIFLLQEKNENKTNKHE